MVNILFIHDDKLLATPKLFRSVFTQKDPEAEPVAKGGRDDGYEPDSDLRDFENVPLKEDIDADFEREVRPHVPDAWMDRSKDKAGYEINFNRHFYKYMPRRWRQLLSHSRRQGEQTVARALVVSTLEGRSSFTEAFRLLGMKKMATFQELGHSLGVGF